MSYETTRSHLLPGAAAKFCYVDTADYETDWHAHDQYMFILPRSGDLSISTEISKAPLQVARAQYALVPSGIYHSTKASLCRQAHLSVYVDGDFVKYCERQAGRSIAQDKTLIWDVPARLRAAIACRDALDDAAHQGLVQYCDELADRLLAALCIEHSIFADSVAVSTGVRRGLLIERIQAFIEARLDEKIEIDRVAAEFGISRRHLTRVFREESGVSVVEFINRLRVKRAAVLLSSPGATVLSVCLAVGLESPSYLAKLFAKYGVQHPRAPRF
jgi:AraC-like DNA-binding protein